MSGRTSRPNCSHFSGGFDLRKTSLKNVFVGGYRTCPDDLMEAISSLIFASARCGDFPELKPVRKFFEERYGQRFAMAAVELHPENLVNPQVLESCS